VSFRHHFATGASHPRQARTRNYRPVFHELTGRLMQHQVGGFEDALMLHTDLERGAPFCSNPACALHVRLLDEEVEGEGNWITLPDGRMFGRSRFGNALLCDACGTRRGPVRLGAARLTN
jgi:hypothetical protein